MVEEDMRIQQIRIDQWRHFSGIQIDVPESSPMICVVGGNGTGKSQLLELIAVCAHRLGLSPGSDVARGDPFHELADFSVRFYLSSAAFPFIDQMNIYPAHLAERFAQWDRTITVGRSTLQEFMFAGGLDWQFASDFSHHVRNAIMASGSVHYLSLDADRSYPRVQIQSHELGSVYDQNWGEELNKKSSFKTSKNLYEEWFRFFIGSENKANGLHIQQIRRAREAGAPEPKFVDQFESYKDALLTVLPHLLFVGIEPQSRQIQFDSTGVSLSFYQLSGGEKEIAFLVGQIERFGLKRGLLLVDEPELHLNNDLLRSWIGYLKSSVEEGQIWITTHSLEAVEVTGQEATIILERDSATRKVMSASALSSQPIISYLSRSVGSPAFSISSLAFAVIEGEEQIGERERFRLLCDVPSHVRFIEGGSCKEVLRRVETLKLLADVSGQAVRIGGVVDGDWREKSEKERITGLGSFVLPVHEIENFFIHPASLAEVVATMGGDPAMIPALLLAAADRRAGTWIFDAVRTGASFREYPEPSKKLRERVHSLDWTMFREPAVICAELANLHGSLDEAQTRNLERRLVAQAKIYKRKREGADFWKVIEGKEVFGMIHEALGFADEDAAERAVTALWKRRPDLVPTELLGLRSYISAL